MTVSNHHNYNGFHTTKGEETSPSVASLSLQDVSASDFVGVAEIHEDQLSAILMKEISYQVLSVPCRQSFQNNNKSSSSSSSSRRPLGEEWRRKICQWSFRVIDHFRLDREVVSFGLNIFDRFLVAKSMASSKSPESSIKSRCECPSCAQSIDSRTYQLAAMTSLYVAIKLHPDNSIDENGIRRKRYFRLESFVELSRGQFEAEDICQMERIILNTLKWKVNPPTPMALVAYLLCLMPTVEDLPLASRPTYDLVLHVLQELSRYLTELSVCLGSLCSTSPPSQVAYAAILVSMDLLTMKALPMRTRDTFHAAVGMVSLQSGGTLLMPHKQKIRRLSQILSKSLLPEMLLEEYDHDTAGATAAATTTPGEAASSSCHPIVIARNYGLLNLSKIHKVCQQGTHSSGTSAGKKLASVEKDAAAHHDSPTGVTTRAIY